MLGRELILDDANAAQKLKNVPSHSSTIRLEPNLNTNKEKIGGCVFDVQYDLP
jgi:hypothetical protein